jgi:STE24 endopeptidase
MAQTVFYLILGIIIFDFVLERILDHLNTTRWSEKLPEKLKGIFDDEEYKKSQAYKKVNHKFEMLTSSFSFLIIFLMLLFKGFAIVNGWALGITENIILSALLFFAILGLASDLLTTPFSIYDTFVIEASFGFNKTTPKIFILDKIKGWALAALLGGGLLALIIFIWSKTGNYFWLWAWGIITIITLFMTMFYSNLIVPLFNKQTPLADGELKQLIQDFSAKAGFQLKNIYIIDGSKRSTKANAYFTGIGPKKRIVLYDTLINDLSNKEIVAVLSHEIGHYKKKHVLTGLLIGILQTGIMLYIFSLLIGSPVLSNALGVTEPRFHIGLIAFGILYSPLSFIMGIFMNMVSRKNEYQADAYASQFGFAEELASGLKKLSVKNLSNLTPHPLYVFFNYSHPTLLQRLNRLENKSL